MGLPMVSGRSLKDSNLDRPGRHPDGSGRRQDGSGWRPDGSGWFRAAPGGSGRLRAVPGGSGRLLVGPLFGPIQRRLVHNKILPETLFSTVTSITSNNE